MPGGRRATPRGRGMSGPATILWRPPEPRDEATQIARYLRWLREHAAAPSPATTSSSAGRSPTSRASGNRCGSSSACAHARPYEQRSRRSRRCRAPSGSRARGSTTPSTRSAPRRTRDRVAVLAPLADPRPDRADLRRAARAGRARRAPGSQRLGVGPGDRVVGYLPNIPETLIAFLAAASLGAIWAACPPEFGPRSVIDRFAIARAEGAAGRRRLPLRREADRPPRRGRRDPRGAADARARRARALLAAARDDALPDARGWDELLARAGAARSSQQVPFDHPLCVLFSSGTTGPAEGDRPRPRRDAGRAPQEPRPELGPAPGRPADVVHDDRLDDVERARVRRCCCAPRS